MGAHVNNINLPNSIKQKSKKMYKKVLFVSMYFELRLTVVIELID